MARALIIAMMKYFALASVLAMLIACSTKSTPNEPSAAGNTAVASAQTRDTVATSWESLIIETSPCKGACPVYQVQISKQGQMDFTGLSHVATLGKKTIQLSANELSELSTIVAQANFASLLPLYDIDTCPNFMTDQSGTVFTLVTSTQRYHSVRNGGCVSAEAPTGAARPAGYPEALVSLANYVTLLTNRYALTQAPTPEIR
jgi:hypothetical protein